MPSCFHINYIILSLTKHFYVSSVVVGVRAMKQEGPYLRRKSYNDKKLYHTLCTKSPSICI